MYWKFRTLNFSVKTNLFALHNVQGSCSKFYLIPILKHFFFSRGYIKPRRVQQYEVIKVVVAVPSRIQNYWSCLPGSSVIYASCACVTSFSFCLCKNWFVKLFFKQMWAQYLALSWRHYCREQQKLKYWLWNETTLLCDCDCTAMKCVMNVHNTRN